MVTFKCKLFVLSKLSKWFSVVIFYLFYFVKFDLLCPRIAGRAGTCHMSPPNRGSYQVRIGVLPCGHGFKASCEAGNGWLLNS